MSLLQEAEELLTAMTRAEKSELLQMVVRDLGDAFPGVESIPGVCGGEPCIVRTRIPVWVLEQARQLVLQRRVWYRRGAALQRPPLRVGSLRSLIADLRLLQPPQQFGGREPLPREEFPHHPIGLRSRQMGHLFPPTPAATSARRHWPADPW